ncbi:MAG: PAS domain-containing protein, partial [Gemmatimonadales bacterium]
MSDTPLPRIHDDVSHLLEALSSQLVIVDRDGQIVAANRAWRNNTRISDYLTGFQLAVHPDLALLGAVRDGVAAVRERTIPEFVIEFPVVSGNEQRWFLLRAAPLGPPDAQQVLIAHVDITDRTRAVRLSALQQDILSLTVADTPLRTTLDRLATALEADTLGAHCVAVTIGPDGTIGSLGAAPSIAAGFADLLEGIRTETLLHFVDSPAVAELMQLPGTEWIEAAIAHGYGNVATTPIRSRSGVNLGVLMLLYPANRTPASNTRAVLAVGASLAAAAIERSRTVRALRERDSRLNSVFVLQPDAVFTLDHAGSIVTGNPAAEQLLGEAAGDFAGTRFEDLVAEAERITFRRHLDKALTGYPQRFTLSLDRPSGPRIDADTTLVPLRTDGGTGSVYLVAKDITEQLASAERLARNSRQMRQSAKLEAVGRLTGGIAHDFNNLLTAIRGYADLLLANASVSGSAREDVQEIARATTRATSLTRQVLSFSRHQGSQRRVIDLNGVVEECRSMLSRLV